MNKLKQALSSRTVWTVIAMFVIGGVQNTAEFIPQDYLPLVMGSLALLAGYFKLNPSQKYE